MKQYANVASLDTADECRQAQVHSYFDDLERAIEVLGNNTRRLHERLHCVVESAAPTAGEKGLRPAYSVPMVERLASLIDQVNSINDETNGVINRLEI